MGDLKFLGNSNSKLKLELEFELDFKIIILNRRIISALMEFSWWRGYLGIKSPRNKKFIIKLIIWWRNKIVENIINILPIRKWRGNISYIDFSIFSES
jgi:hypothetical protein